MARSTPQEKVVKALEKEIEQIRARIEREKIREQIAVKELQHAKARAASNQE